MFSSRFLSVHKKEGGLYKEKIENQAVYGKFKGLAI